MIPAHLDAQDVEVGMGGLDGGRNMTQAIGFSIKALASTIGLLICLVSLGCGSAPTVHLTPESAPAQSIVLSEAWYVVDQDVFRIIGKTPPRPSSVRIVTLGAVKDADSPAYYVYVTIPKEGRDAELSLLIAPWEGGQLLRGRYQAIPNQLADNELALDADCHLKTVKGHPTWDAQVTMKGRMKLSMTRFAALLAEYERELTAFRR